MMDVQGTSTAGYPAALAASVIERAVHDATWASPFASVTDKASSAPSVVDRDEAVLFLLSDGGEWADSRELWCEALDLCPEYLRDSAVKALRLITDIQTPFVLSATEALLTDLSPKQAVNGRRTRKIDRRNAGKLDAARHARVAVVALNLDVA